MKNLIIVLALFLSPSCRTMESVMGLPAAVVSDTGDAISVVVPHSADPEAAAIGKAAGDAAGIITGNPLIDMGVTAVVGAAAAFFLRRKRQPVVT